MRFFPAAVAVLAIGCAALPVRSTTGARVVRITITESLALRAHQPARVELSGADLGPAVSLLDRHGVLKLTPEALTSYGADGSSVVVDVELAGGGERRFVLSNCPEPHVCGFLRDAVASGLLTRLPETCRVAPAPCAVSGCTPCPGPRAEQPLPAACAELIDPSTCSDYLACRPVPDGDGGTTTMPGCAR